MFARTCAIAATVASLLALPAVAAEKPIPGGAYQMVALSGTVGKTLFNGMVRFKLAEVRDATADEANDLHPSPSQKGIVISTLVRNGLHETFVGTMTYTLADKDDVTVDVPAIAIKPDGGAIDIPQAASSKERMVILVDKDYVPTKLLVTCSGYGKRFKPFRITIPR